MRYVIGSPNGWRGSEIHAVSDEEAKAAAALMGETVVDLMDWQDEDGRPCVLLVVPDEGM